MSPLDSLGRGHILVTGELEVRLVSPAVVGSFDGCATLRPSTLSGVLVPAVKGQRLFIMRLEL